MVVGDVVVDSIGKVLSKYPVSKHVALDKV